MTVVAGRNDPFTAGFSGDGGPATLAQLNQPEGMRVDSLDNLYFGDTNNSRIRKVDGSGTITTAAIAEDLYSEGDPYLPGWVAVDRSGNIYFDIGDVVYRVEANSVPPETTITGGPRGVTNDPTPTLRFSSSEPGSTFQCRVDSAPYASCASPRTTRHLADGSHTFYVRATDPAGNPDPTPATRTFTVRTAAIGISGTTLVVTAAAGAKDNLRITRPSASVLRVTDFPSGAYTGSGVHTGAGCTRVGDYTANCSGEIARIKVSSADGIDRVVNLTVVQSSQNGGSANDTLTGGSSKDLLTGGGGADVLKGMNGNDQLFARDGTSDTTINCDGGIGTPGAADKADLDKLPKDPNSVVTNCETRTRH
jgi:Ca2+-binding RTX toxin-like protein